MATPRSTGRRRTPYLLLLLVNLALMGGGVKSHAQNACVQPPPEILAWWPFDESAGPIAEELISGRIGRDMGAPPPFPIAGEVANALRFDGISDYVAVANDEAWNFGSNDFSIELWANFLAPADGFITEPSDILIGHDEGSGYLNKWFFGLGGGYIYFHINSPTLGPKFFPLIPFTPVVDTWYHLAVTRSGSLYSIYIDGSLAGTAMNTASVPAAQALLTIGQAENLGYVNGILDEVTIYDRALTAQEVASIWTAGSAGKCKPGIALQIRSFCELWPRDNSFHQIAVVAATDAVSEISSLAVTVQRNGVPVDPSDIQIEGTGLSPRTVYIRTVQPDHGPGWGGTGDGIDHGLHNHGSKPGVNEYTLTVVGKDAAANSATAVSGCTARGDKQ